MNVLNQNIRDSVKESVEALKMANSSITGVPFPIIASENFKQGVAIPSKSWKIQLADKNSKCKSMLLVFENNQLHIVSHAAGKNDIADLIFQALRRDPIFNGTSLPMMEAWYPSEYDNQHKLGLRLRKKDDAGNNIQLSHGAQVAVMVDAIAYMMQLFRKVELLTLVPQD